MEAYERDVMQKIKQFEQRISEDQRAQLHTYRMKKRVKYNEKIGGYWVVCLIDKWFFFDFNLV